MNGHYFFPAEIKEGSKTQNRNKVTGKAMWMDEGEIEDKQLICFFGNISAQQSVGFFFFNYCCF